MARKIWTEEEVAALEKHIRGKVARKEPLTYGEDTLWGVLKNGKPLTVRMVEDIDHMAGIHD